jgi:hypothetical protein
MNFSIVTLAAVFACIEDLQPFTLLYLARSDLRTK